VADRKVENGAQVDVPESNAQDAKPGRKIRAALAFREIQSPREWDQAVTGLPGTHPLQSWAWGAFKSRWRWSMRPLVLQLNESEPEPAWAAALVLKRQLPRLPLSILYVPKGPLLNYNDRRLRRVVLAQLETLARQERAILIKIDPDVVSSWDLEQERVSPVGAAFVRDLQNRGWRYSNEQVQFRNTMVLDLERPPDEILAAMKQKTRYNIRLAERKGVTVRPGTAADLPAVAEMYLSTAARDNFTVRPAAYYLDGWQTLSDAGMAQPLLAEYEGELLAAVVLVRYGRRVIYMYGASSEKERQRMPNYLLQWEAIRWAQAQGAAVYDFWGAPDDFVETDPLWGVWRFKAGFNGQVVRHIGAWDYPARPFWYWLYTVALPRYLAFLRRRQPSAVSQEADA
jgi:peptidoglycan pentaglycine glycine transferase (the first glycine)